MNRLFRMLSALLAMLLMTACGKTTPLPSEIPEEPTSLQEEPQVAEESFDLSVFDGIYRANVPQEGDAGYVQIRAQNGLILLEHYLCMDGSVYSFWAEEFWPNEDGFSQGDFTSVSGMSQTFSMMTAGESYDTMPQNRVITLTEDGVVLNYDDSDAEYYVKDTEFSYHTSKKELGQRLGESTAKKDESLFGTWVYRNSRDAVCVSFEKDGGISLLRKKVGQPAQVYHGAFIFEQGGSVSVMAEKVGDGQYPYVMSLQWKVDRDNMLWLTFEDEEQIILMPTRQDVTETVEREYAQGYLAAQYDISGEYTDMYETEYVYTYKLPQFLGGNPKTVEVNEQIMEEFSPIIEEELGAMEQGEFLTFTDVNWESNVYAGILYLHIYAKTWDWEEHSAYYYDVKTGEFLTTKEVLDRLLIDPSYFLEAVREHAQAAFEETFAELPEEYRQEYGYYDMLQWTGSDEAVNFDLPIYVDRFGSIAVHARLGSMAGSGIIWTILRPFDGAVG